LDIYYLLYYKIGNEGFISESEVGMDNAGQESWTPLSVKVSLSSNISVEPVSSCSQLYEAGISMANGLVSPLVRNKWAKKCASGNIHIVLIRGARKEIMGLGVLGATRTEIDNSWRLTPKHISGAPDLPPPFFAILKRVVDIYVDCLNSGAVPSNLREKKNGIAPLPERRRAADIRETMSLAANGVKP
jgi:hypothetical protein